MPTSSTPRPRRWQSRAEILKSYLDSLSPDDLLRVRPVEYALRYGPAARRRHCLRKANFDPNQPRVPAGNPDGGQWTRVGGGAGRNDPRVISDAMPDNDWIPGAQYAQGPRGRGPFDRRPPIQLHIPGMSPSVSRGQVTISNSAQTGFSTIDETTENLIRTLEIVVNSLPPGSGTAYGQRVHIEFAKAVRGQNLRGIGWRGVEQTFGVEPDARYGAKFSIRTDTTLRNDVGDPVAIYDVKTGTARLKPKRVQELRDRVRAGNKIPVIELHVIFGASLKGRARYPRKYWLIIARLWHPALPDIGGLVADAGLV